MFFILKAIGVFHKQFAKDRPRWQMAPGPVGLRWPPVVDGPPGRGLWPEDTKG